MELHTLGIEGGYTGNGCASKRPAGFTGWNVSRLYQYPVFAFITTRYWRKTVLGNAIPAGRGIEDGNQVLIFSRIHRSTPVILQKDATLHTFHHDHPQTFTSIRWYCYSTSATNGNISAMLLTIWQSAWNS
jgi:uncharacterized protein (DUF1800 family)